MLISNISHADDSSNTQIDPYNPKQPSVSLTPAFLYGPYVAILGSYADSGDSQLSKRTPGGMVSLGWRRPRFGIEIEGLINGPQSKTSDGGLISYGGELALLAYPLSMDRNFYFLLGGGVDAYNSQKTTSATFSNGLLFDIGLGQMFMFHLGTHQLGLRMDARFRHEQVSKSSMPDNPITIENPPRGDSTQVNFNDVVVNIGLQFPFGTRHHADAPPDVTLKVVPVEKQENSTPSNNP